MKPGTRMLIRYLRAQRLHNLGRAAQCKHCWERRVLANAYLEMRGRHGAENYRHRMLFYADRELAKNSS